ncbi:Protein phosphatase 1 regulatory subunit 42 [Hondaea fermentalgiana]|uniref:Protein phosphatase 1 regulatory subunit 42 n=1 Tax=Hondaea fermentalgiana TaxID=2315210 RepID=A0A2R5GGK3_9STRA|nr:Protein phosphatase 1 regulatory subunit 42 [Hondaea fermentalgiana]|eukprot:GBG27391.1 Protein phosphatase 1 regulatory subunit 42 [Hondaea fermentalgiana]
MVRKATTMRQHSTEEKAHFFEKITNLSLHGRRIRAIQNLHMCTNLRVLFLYNNCIERIENLSFAKNLTHLYLENNRIRRIEDLANLAHLTKLSLDGNCISTLEGLEGCSSLTELHLSNQRLELGQTFEFDPQSIAGLADSLQLLTIANSQVESIAPLGGLANLQILRASHNPHLAGGVDSLEELVKGCVFLQEVDFADTPLAATPNYRDTLIAKSEYVSLIDGKLVQPNQREQGFDSIADREHGRRRKQHIAQWLDLYDNEQQQPGFPSKFWFDALGDDPLYSIFCAGCLFGTCTPTLELGGKKLDVFKAALEDVVEFSRVSVAAGFLFRFSQRETRVS